MQIDEACVYYSSTLMLSDYGTRWAVWVCVSGSKDSTLKVFSAGWEQTAGRFIQSDIGSESPLSCWGHLDTAFHSLMSAGTKRAAKALTLGEDETHGEKCSAAQYRGGKRVVHGGVHAGFSLLCSCLQAVHTQTCNREPVPFCLQQWV